MHIPVTLFESFALATSQKDIINTTVTILSLQIFYSGERAHFVGFSHLNVLGKVKQHRV